MMDQAVPQGLTAVQWRTLQLAPLWVLSGIVGRQRDFEPMEISAFWRGLDAAAAGNDGLSRMAPDALSGQFTQFLLDFQDEPRSVVTGLWDVVAILNRLDPLVSVPFTAMLLEIGTSFCRARGSFGQVISRDDQQTLLLLAALLELEPAGGQAEDSYA